MNNGCQKPIRVIVKCAQKLTGNLHHLPEIRNLESQKGPEEL